MAILTNSDVAIYHAVLLLYHSQMLVSFFRRNQLNHPAPRNPIHRGPQAHCLASRTHIHSVMYYNILIYHFHLNVRHSR